MSKKTMIPFWMNDPTILLNKNYLGEIWPTSSMTYEQKLNSITRLIVIATVLGYLITFSTKILISGILMIPFIYLTLEVAAIFVNMQTFLGVFCQTIFAGLAGVFIYIVTTRVLKSPELKTIKSSILSQFTK